MLCPEGTQIQNDPVTKEEDGKYDKSNNIVPADGSGSVELATYKAPKTWKKSISNFFRNQLRSTKSNEGDCPTGSQENFEEKEVSPEQKWQSLGKIFRRQSFVDYWEKSPNQQGESSHSKRSGVRKVISSYFGKTHKSNVPSQPPEN